MQNYTNLNFAVLMAVYKKDSPSLFHKAIDSVYSNSLQPGKFVIVADGPLTDDLENVLNKFSNQKNLLIIRLPENVGLASALNVGLACIDAEYTIRADADDINSRNRFEKLIAMLVEGYDVVGSSILEVDENGLKIAIRKLPTDQNSITSFARKRNPFNHMSVAYRTKIVINAGGYPLIHLKEDYALWATLISSGARLCNIDELLVNATTGRDMFQRRGGVKYALAEIDMQRHLVRVGLKGYSAAFFDGFVRACVFLMPSFAREFIYLKLLRFRPS